MDAVDTDRVNARDEVCNWLDETVRDKVHGVDGFNMVVRDVSKELVDVVMKLCFETVRVKVRGVVNELVEDTVDNECRDSVEASRCNGCSVRFSVWYSSLSHSWLNADSIHSVSNEGTSAGWYT